MGCYGEAMECYAEATAKLWGLCCNYKEGATRYETIIGKLWEAMAKLCGVMRRIWQSYVELWGSYKEVTANYETTMGQQWEAMGKLW